MEIVDSWQPDSDAEAQAIESQRLTDREEALHMAYLRREELRNEELVHVFAEGLDLDPWRLMQTQLWVRFVNAAIHVSLEQCRKARESGASTPAGDIFREVSEAAGLLPADDRRG